MRKFAYITAAILSVTGICLGLVADDAPPVKKEKTATQAKTVTKPAAKAEKDDAKASQPVEQTPADQEDDVPAKFTADEAAIRKANESLLKAYASDSPQAVAEHFTQDGEYVNSSGAVFHGREAIQDSLTAFFAEHPGCELQAELHDLRFVSPTVAVVEGTTTVIHEHDTLETNCNFTAIYNKLDGQWLIASVRDQMHVVKPSHETQLEQLSFLIGDWVNEDSDSVVTFSCRPTENGKFLIRDFTMKVHGQDVLSGTERIGWDPVSGRLRAWIFDSEGGFADGTWSREGDTWILKLNGVSSDGELASGNSIYRVIDNHSVSWQAVDHVIGGVASPDSPEFTLVHRSPHPLDQDEKTNENNNDKKPTKSAP